MRINVLDDMIVKFLRKISKCSEIEGFEHFNTETPSATTVLDVFDVNKIVHYK